MQRIDAQVTTLSVNYTFQLDMRQLSDGMHKIYLRAYNPSCVDSIADYGGTRSVPGMYYPIHFTVKNGSATPSTQHKSIESNFYVNY